MTIFNLPTNHNWELTLTDTPVNFFIFHFLNLLFMIWGIGSTKTKLHQVQQRIADAHGSQCGFCTPGIVMSMYTLLRNDPNPKMEDIETYFQVRQLLTYLISFKSSSVRAKPLFWVRSNTETETQIGWYCNQYWNHI